MTSSKERASVGKRVALVGACVNFLLAILKLVVGYFGRSQALMADGVHSFSDLICDFLVLIAAKYGSAEADEDHPYGHQRIETLITLALGLILMIVGVGVAIDACIDIAHHRLEVPSYLTVVIAFISIIANEGLYFYTMSRANQINSDVLRASAAHARTDSLSSLVVLAGLVGSILGWTFLDAIAAIIVALLIIKIGFEWAFKAIVELTDKGLDEDVLAEIRRTILNCEGVLQMHQLRTRAMASQTLLDVHILIRPYTSASEGHQIAESVRVALDKTFPHITDSTIHVDVENHPEALPPRLLPSRQEVLDLLMPKWASMISQQDIRHVDLYYLHGAIEMRLCLSLQLLHEHEHATLVACVNDSIEASPDMASIKLSFA